MGPEECDSSPLHVETKKKKRTLQKSQRRRTLRKEGNQGSTGVHGGDSANEDATCPHVTCCQWVNRLKEWMRRGCWGCLCDIFNGTVGFQLGTWLYGVKSSGRNGKNVWWIFFLKTFGVGEEREKRRVLAMAAGLRKTFLGGRSWAYL